jgi:hypothetical protein
MRTVFLLVVSLAKEAAVMTTSALQDFTVPRHRLHECEEPWPVEAVGAFSRVFIGEDNVMEAVLVCGGIVDVGVGQEAALASPNAVAAVHTEEAALSFLAVVMRHVTQYFSKVAPWMVGGEIVVLIPSCTQPSPALPPPWNILIDFHVLIKYFYVSNYCVPIDCGDS